MSSSDDFARGSDEGHIADTGMFQRFVENEAELQSGEKHKDSFRIWMTILVITVIVAGGVMVWTLTR